ncbi:MAG: Tat pathway signal protein, partial [Gammaproteobacteria bacterium]|nr:Tat pathway signal protein [Gammaproteobacteria bacterium]
MAVASGTYCRVPVTASAAARARSTIAVLLTLLLVPVTLVQAAAAPQPRGGTAAPPSSAAPQARPHAGPLLADLEERTFRYFWETANPLNGLVPDRYPGPPVASVAAVGFALTAYPIGIERGYVSRSEARARVLATLRFFARAHNEHGFFYHFIDMRTGLRANNSEVSTVDTALLLAGMLFCQSYFDSSTPQDREIRRLTLKIYAQADWTWAQPRSRAVALAWTPEEGFSGSDWSGYNEAMLVYILALGSPTHPISADAWAQWTST